MNIGWRRANTLRANQLPKLPLITRLKANRSLRREQSLIAFWCRRYWPIAALLLAYAVVSYVDGRYQEEINLSDQRLFDFMNSGVIYSKNNDWAMKCSEFIEVTQ